MKVSKILSAPAASIQQSMSGAFPVKEGAVPKQLLAQETKSSVSVLQTAKPRFFAIFKRKEDLSQSITLSAPKYFKDRAAAIPMVPHPNTTAFSPF